jgi:pimeloyl-ACP methyl ester carboxylesterase
LTADVSSPLFTPSTFEFQGCRFALQRAGTGPPVVFIQGVGVQGRGWTPQIAALASRFACVCFDNRGMSESQPAACAITVGQMAEDALGLMTHLGWASAHLVGHSLGGPIALEMALRQRSRVRSLTLLCTLARGRDATRLSGRMLWLGLRSRLGPRAARRRAFIEIVMPPGAVSRDQADRLADELAPLFGHDLADQPPIAMQQLGALRKYDATARVPQLAGIPTLVVSATHDPIAPPRFGRALAAAIAGARFVEFPDASHGLPIQHAAAVNALLIEHLQHAESARTREPSS